MKSLKELRKLGVDDLKKELIESKKKVYELKMKLAASELKQTHLIKPLRRYCASIQTVLSEQNI